jgi:hypothetical protein
MGYNSDFDSCERGFTIARAISHDAGYQVSREADLGSVRPSTELALDFLFPRSG